MASEQPVPPIPPPITPQNPTSTLPSNTTNVTSKPAPAAFSFPSPVNLPPFTEFIYAQGQSSTQLQQSSFQSQQEPHYQQSHTFNQDPPVIHTSPGQRSGPHLFGSSRYGDGNEGYDEFEESYLRGVDGNQLRIQGQVGYGSNFQTQQQMQQWGGPHVNQIPEPLPLQQVPQQPHYQQPQFQQPNPQQQAPQHMQQRPVYRQMGQPRVPLGVPKRHAREKLRGIEAHFRPIITNNPSPVVIPQNQNGRTFEVRTNALQSLPKYKGLATEEPYFHLEAYDSICNTIGGQGFTPDEVKLVLFQFSLEDKAKVLRCSKGS